MEPEAMNPVIGAAPERIPTWKRVARLVNGLLAPVGVRIVRRSDSRYLKVADVLADAKAAGLDVYDYLEDLLALNSSAAAAIGELDRLGGLRDCRTVVEIGPGSGAYLREMLARAPISQVFIYETAEDWRTWLQRHYPVDAKPTTGHSLDDCPDRHAQVVAAHGVFVYVDVLNAYEYFFEMMRVCAPGGYVIFDFFPSEDFDVREARYWFEYEYRYPLVVLSRMRVVELFADEGFRLLHQFKNVTKGTPPSEYLIFRSEPIAIPQR
jgi:hypothetical protein